MVSWPPPFDGEADGTRAAAKQRESKIAGGLPCRLPCLSLQPTEQILDFRGGVGVMVHDLPATIFSTIDVGGTPLPTQLLSSDLALKSFRADSVCCILGYGDHLEVVHGASSLREHRARLLPGGENLIAPYLSTAKGMHGRPCLSLRPRGRHRSRITGGKHLIEPRIELIGCLPYLIFRCHIVSSFS